MSFAKACDRVVSKRLRHLYRVVDMRHAAVPIATTITRLVR
jgi:hypothetical protein